MRRRLQPHRSAVRIAGLAVAILVLSSPQILAGFGAPAPSYPTLTVIFAALLLALVVAWPWPHGTDRSDIDAGLKPVAVMVAGAATIVIAIGMFRWTRMVVWQPTQADMLIVIREATRRFLNGKNPYTTYRSYDAPWNMAFPYGPGLWGPYVPLQFLRVDFRLLSIVGQLFVPVWCGLAAVAESARGRIVHAITWLGVLAALVLAFDSAGFALLGHTPVYWPLLPVLAVTVVRRRWVAAAATLGILVVARSTMVSLIPVLVMTVWREDRRGLRRAAGALAVPIAAALLPFIVWDPRAIWDSMVLSYPRVMKIAVWDSARPGAVATIGSTGWLLERHLDALVEPVQAAVMIAAYTILWLAVARGSHPLGCMTLALLAFSMTTYYPVSYIYYDVLLLLVSGALVETLEEGRLRLSPGLWAATLAALVLMTAATVRTMASPFPSVAAGEVAPERPLRRGFDRSERDGQRHLSWIVGTEATIVIPRSSAAAADIVLSALSPFGADEPSQLVTAVLNGQLIGQARAQAGWQDILFSAPASTWWIGYNELRLTLAAAVRPHDVGAGSDRRRLSLALSRVDLVASGK
jgi:hypothetical protein